MTERIGLEAYLGTAQYNSGVKTYLRGLSSMEKQTGSVAGTLSSQFAGLGQNVIGFGVRAAGVALEGIRALTEALFEFGAAAVTEGMAYTQAMSNVAAITQATDEQFQNLMISAEGLGRTTKFTATEAAEGMSFLAMAGFEAEEVISAMPGVLDLAAAGNLNLARSADIVSNVMTGFGATAEETQRFVDVLTKTFISSNTNLTQLGYGMKYVAPIANDLGVTVEDTAAAMGALGDAGIQGTAAGTALRAIFLRLAAPTGAAADTIKELGVQLFDAQGQMLPFPQIIGNFNNALAGMSDQQRQVALKTIFGMRAVAGFSVLLKRGEDDLQDFGDELRDSMGTASEVAQTQLDNLTGDVTLFKSALSGIKIDIFKAMEPFLRAVVKQGKLLLEVYGPQLAATFDEVVTVITDFISRGEELFAIFQRGGLPAIAESLGITPQAIELLDKIKTDLFGIGDAVGTSVGPILQWLADNVMAGLNTAIEFLNQHWEEFKGAIIGVGAVLASAAIAAIIAGIVTALGTILSPIGLLIAGAALLGAAWVGNWFGIRDTMMAAWTAIQPILIQIQAGLLTLWEIVKAVWAGIVAAMQPAIESIISAFANITQALERMGLSWGEVGQAILIALGIVVAGIGVAVVAILSVIVGLVNGVAAMLENMTAAWQRMTEAVMLILEGLVTQFVGWREVVRGILNLDMAQIAQGFVLIWQGVQQVWAGIWQGIVAILQGSVGSIIALIQGLVEGIVNFWTGLYETLVGGSIIPDMVTSIIDWFNRLVEPIVSTLDSLASKVTGIFGEIFGVISSGDGGDGEGLFNIDLSGLLGQIRSLVPLMNLANEAVTTFSVSTTTSFEQVRLKTNEWNLLLLEIIQVTLPELQVVSQATTQIIIAGFTKINALLIITQGLLIQISVAFKTVAKAAEEAVKAIENISEAHEPLKKTISLVLEAQQAFIKMAEAAKMASQSATDAGSAIPKSVGGNGEGNSGFQHGTPPGGVRIPGGRNQLSWLPVHGQEIVHVVPAGQASHNTTSINTTSIIQNINIVLNQGEGLTEAQSAVLLRQNIQRQLGTL